MANNITNDNETLTGYDQINDPNPVEWDNPFQTDNNSQRNPYEQRVYTFVSASPPISLSELYEMVYSTLADHSQPSTIECVASTVQEIQENKVESLMVHWVPVKRFTYRNGHFRSRKSLRH